MMLTAADEFRRDKKGFAHLCKGLNVRLFEAVRQILLQCGLRARFQDVGQLIIS